MSFGSLLGAYKSGVDVDKMWITCADEKVRRSPYSHEILDRQRAGLFKPFNNGEQIKYPGDPDASKANTINCRCCQMFVEKPRARPRVTNRRLTNFLIDFFSGFFLGSELLETLLAQTGGE